MEEKERAEYRDRGTYVRHQEECAAFLRAKERVRAILDELAEVCHDVRANSDGFGAPYTARENLQEDLENLGVTYSWLCLAAIEADPKKQEG